MTTLDCTCPADIAPGTYRTGCPRHIAQHLAAKPYARTHVETHVVRYFHAEVTVSTPVRVGDGVAERTQHLSCSHNHTSREAAEACGASLARRAV